MSSPPESGPHSFAALAARREPRAQHWEKRFAALLDSGVLKLSRRPATESALHVRRQPFSEPELAARFCAERYLDVRANAGSLGIDISCLEMSEPQAWVKQFQTEFDRLVRDAGELLFSIDAAHPHLLALLELRQPAGADSPAFAVRFDAATPAQVWRELGPVAMNDADIHLIPAMAGRLLSGLHGAERPGCVLPQSLLEVSTDSAWLMLDIDAAKLGNSLEIRRCLADTLRFADNLIDEVAWSRPALQLDALLNRRVGLHLTGLGDRLLEAGLHPATSRGFLWLRRWLRFVRNCMVHESVVLAQKRGPFPELGAAELIAELAPRYGNVTARKLVRNRFLRHRHLLALSPFELFPEGFAARDLADWCNLLPAIDCADALTMYGKDPRGLLGEDAWQRFLQQVSVLCGVRPHIAHKRLS